MEEHKNSINHKYAGFGRRTLSTLVDSLVLFLIGTGISLALGRNPFDFDQDTANGQATLDYLLTPKFRVVGIMQLLFVGLPKGSNSSMSAGRERLGPR